MYNERILKKPRKDKHFVHKAYFKGGNAALSKFIRKELKYPEAATLNKIEGTVKLNYEVNFKGKVHSVKVLSGIGYGCDEEAVRLIKMVNYEVPKTHKLKVGFKKKINIHFKLKKEPKELAQDSSKTKVNTYNYTLTEKTKAKDSPRQGNGYHYTIQM